MKIMRFLKIFLFLLVVAAIFIVGIIVGNSYNVTDFLCPAKSYPHKLEHDFVSKEGILLPKGTLIHVRHCAYMQRFNWQFAIDKNTPLIQYTGKPEYEYNFSELYPINEINQQ
jgi:hypothetical protein